MAETFGQHLAGVEACDSGMADAGKWKRKRPHRTSAMEHSGQYDDQSNKKRPSHTLNSAMFLVILALGKLCLHRAKNSNTHQPPGIEYISLAFHILTPIRGGWSLQYSQTSILAAIYYGQLGRFIDSQLHVLDAERALQVHTRCSLDRLVNNVEPIGNTQDNSVLLAFWTCFQLERDVIEVANLPLSTFVYRYKDAMPWPNVALLAEHFPPSVAHHFLGHLHLQKRLSDVYSGTTLSPVDFRCRMFWEEDENRKILLDTNLKFEVEDPPPNDLMEARLRAKFLSVQAAMFRPLIKTVLSDKTQLDQAAGAELTVTLQRGISFIIKGIEAFHGLSDENLLGNIFAIAHRQALDLMTLAAIYRSSSLGNLIDGRKLRCLFKRTVGLLEFHSQPGSAMMGDKTVLLDVYQALFPISDKESPESLSIV
ncbi:hypothetical protein CCUS01_06563 [Colletotrichum cuscutae]|uniref:C6 zinc finger domain-containing protein n=1 Tax=Colletotrichum cuscutae TaxID=1209917 RepID=A0AAI9Y490_9PEZI|nr:hypothetical protein CCUS01_06563 [Colletotrichum cuscutae]